MITPSSFRLNAALWVLLALALAGVLTLLSPILTPFLIGAMLAYVCNPLVTRVEQLGAPRALGALLALLLIFAWLALILLIIVPLLRDEALRILTRMPDAIALYNQSVAPRLSEWFGTQLQLDPQLLQSLATDNWNVVQTILQRIYDSLRIGGLAEATGGPAFATCAGLLSYAVSHYAEAPSALAPRMRNDGDEPAGLFGRFGGWLRENF